MLFLANKFIEKKLLHSGNVKEYYQLFLRKENRKLVKQPEIITYQPKTFENPNIVDIKLIITEHRRTSHKLSNIFRQAEKVSSNSSLYSDAKKVEVF